MATQRNLSTISYNTDEFLKQKLDDLLAAHKIQYFFAMKHQPEDDEAGTKYHWHVHLKPNVPLDICELKEYFLEPDPLHPELPPLGTKLWKLSSTFDAYLYFLHDPLYLHSKNQSRRYAYKPDEFLTNDVDELAVIAYDAYHSSKWALDMMVNSAMTDGRSLARLIEQGCVPITLAPSLRAWRGLKLDEIREGTYRNGREGHE